MLDWEQTSSDRWEAHNGDELIEIIHGGGDYDVYVDYEWVGVAKSLDGAKHKAEEAAGMR